MKTTATFILVFITLISTTVIGQDFPILIKKGETKTIAAPDSQSLFVLLRSQVLVYEDSINELDFARRRIDLLTTENLLWSEKEQIYIRDTVIYSNLYHHYHSLWDSTDHQLEKTEIKLARVQHNKWNFGITGILIGVIATLLIVNVN